MHENNLVTRYIRIYVVTVIDLTNKDIQKYIVHMYFHNQVASAINFLHQKHVLHCDLKSSNVLVWEFPLPGQQNSNQRVLLKIADYGVSRMYNVTNQIRYGTIAGTPGFIAPEVYKGKYKDLQSDKVCIMFI